MILRLCLLILCCSSISLFAVGKHEPDLFAGNIIAFSGKNNDPGVFDCQIYLYYSRLYGLYDQNSRLVKDRNVHQMQVELEMAYGLLKNIDFTLELLGFQIHNNGNTVYQWGDTLAFLGFQLLKGKKGTCVPDLRFLIGANLPTGKYDNLDPIFSGGDGVGEGAYSAFFTVITSKVFEGKHPFSLNVNLIYLISSPVQVKGRNVYIDNPLARGEIKPGVEFEVDFAFEYKFNRPWGIGMDFYFQQQNSSAFQNKSTDVVLEDAPSSYLFSLVPTIQYNFNEKMNMIAGSWFTVTGRNEEAFRSLVFSFYRKF